MRIRNFMSHAFCFAYMYSYMYMSNSHEKSNIFRFYYQIVFFSGIK